MTKAASDTCSGILVQDLSMGYGTTTVLDNINLHIRHGEFLTLLGPSGSGKSTLLMLLAGFMKPNAGSIRFDDREMVLVEPHKRNVGVVFQNYALFPHMNVFENISYPLRLRGHNRTDIAHRVSRILELVRLPDFTTRRVDQLSGGQQQRVAIARALVFEPTILLMDEPLSALDRKLREEMQIELRDLHRALGITTAYVTHDQREALSMSDRIAVLNNGRIEQVGTPDQLYERPANQFVGRFIGESTLLEIEVLEGRAKLQQQQFPLPKGMEGLGRGMAFLIVRPEKLEISMGERVPGRTYFDGTVLDSIYQGDSILLRLGLAEGVDLRMRLPSSQFRKLAPNESLTVSLHNDDLVVVPVD